ncbi:unnamed protein product [Kuraishia capsulata CBS 1993]|uniref:Glycosyltransferase family 8 protein n=1 Tax=Kuraishia capsulata CBS 1993 TaxID=1382522 RepID=W6MWF3_9ASCO|nr:uncharacterized protein KUCA_T00003323001 [Kuraishia capsulata CBS 1993]CDK27345.1 unnamed protein product [Kuraishia capsulata CBS 1993]
MITRRSKLLIRRIILAIALLWMFQRLRMPPTKDLAYSALRYDASKVKFVPHELISLIYGKVQHLEESKPSLDWSRFAYVQYATDLDYICNAVINFAKLREEFGTKADLVLMYYKGFSYNPHRLPEKQYKPESRLLQEAEAEFGIKLIPVSMISLKSDSTTWEESFTKLHLFELEQYDRVIFFDSDSTVNLGMDHLFFLPPSLVALPVLYTWPISNPVMSPAVRTCEQRQNQLQYFYEKVVTGMSEMSDEFSWNVLSNLPVFTPWDDLQFTTALMVVQPNKKMFKKLMKLTKGRSKSDYDMEIVNKFLQGAWTKENAYFNEKTDTVEPLLTVLGHHDLLMLTGELTVHSLRGHSRYMMDPNDLQLSEIETPENAYWKSKECAWSLVPETKKTKLFHFSDHPVPKPWKPQDSQDHENIDCVDRLTSSSDKPECNAIRVWNQLYVDYAKDRMEYCNLDI